MKLLLCMISILLVTLTGCRTEPDNLAATAKVAATANDAATATFAATAAPAQPLPPQALATATAAPTRTRAPSATAYERAPTAAAWHTAEALRPTTIYQTNSAFEQTYAVEYQRTSTALVRDIQATLTPRAFQSLPSPDGRWLAEVIIYDCARILPEPESTTAYEVLRISATIVETQLLSCGGIGAAGLSGLFWSADSRFFYYTDAREGWPDGGYPWRRPISRYDVTTGQSQTLALAEYSPDQKKIAGVQENDLVIWEVASDAEAHFAGPPQPSGWINWLTWSPDGRSLAYLFTDCQDVYPCPTLLVRVDLESQAQTQLLDASDPPMLEVQWLEPNTLRLLGSDFQSQWSYDLITAQLMPAPTATPTAAGARPSPTLIPPTRTPAPTYPPDPAFPAAIYPPALPYRQPPPNDRWMTGSGCPNATHLQITGQPSSETLKPVLEVMHSGDVYLNRQHSDQAHWPATGLSMGGNAYPIYRANISVQPASRYPQAAELTHLCGAQVVNASWWANINNESGAINNYFIIQRGGRWLVWMGIFNDSVTGTQ